MSELNVGFARMDVTPKLGTTLAGYPRTRYADGVLDPLTASVVVFDDCNKRVLIYAIDHLGLGNATADMLRTEVAAAAETDPDAVYISCSHTHLAPRTWGTENADYIDFLLSRMKDAAALAIADLKPATLSYTRALVPDVSFVRRFRMKDGSCRTNPGFQNPEIDHTLNTPDEEASLLIIKREGGHEIAIAHFQVHPDTISGEKISADFPHFVRQKYEELVPGARCMYLNGTQGDTNHIDVRLGSGELRRGYKRTRYMGEKIAMALVANIPLARPMDNTQINYGHAMISLKYNKAKNEQEIEEAKAIRARFAEGGIEAVGPKSMGMLRVSLNAQANRIVSLLEQPDEGEVRLGAVKVGDFAVVGFPGEPFTDVGRTVKQGANCRLAMPTCCSNGYITYFPTKDAYEYGSYEGMSARYAEGSAEQLADGAVELINSL